MMLKSSIAVVALSAAALLGPAAAHAECIWVDGGWKCDGAPVQVWQLDFEQGKCRQSPYDVQKFYIAIANNKIYQPADLHVSLDYDSLHHPVAEWIMTSTRPTTRESDDSIAVTWVFTPGQEFCEKLRATLGVSEADRVDQPQWVGGRTSPRGWWQH
jgi:hypothetical protein